MTRCFFTILFAMTFQNSSAQTLAEYTDQLYFGMFSLHPDSAITGFLERYMPFVLEKHDTKAKWTMYPPGVTEEPKFETVVNSYVFCKHPYFQGPFLSGQLAFTMKVYANKDRGTQWVSTKLWFECDNEKDAHTSFRQLIDSFSRFNTLKRMSSQQGMEKVEFTDKHSGKTPSRIQIILMPDYTLESRTGYFSEDNEANIIYAPGYRIVVETRNDLR
jgi:hypothetical protein